MQEIDDILSLERNEPKTFHPVKERGGSAWFPGNEAASLLVQIRHIWDDLSELHKLHKTIESSHTKKLILKYVVIETRSLVDAFDRLQAITLKAPIFDPYKKQGWRELTKDEHEKARQLLKTYSKAKSQTINSIIQIRNEIGAHRGNLDWQKVMEFWDKITPDVVNPILSSIPAAFDYIKSLDLYEWNLVHENGAHEFISFQLRAEYLADSEEA